MLPKIETILYTSDLGLGAPYVLPWLVSIKQK